MDNYDQFIDPYEQMKQRAKEVFEISAKHFPYRHKESINSIEFFNHEDTFDIETSWYCCGDHNTEWYSFPMEYLSKSNEQLDVLFAEEKVRQEEKEQLEREAQQRAEKERHEAWERNKLFELLEKYGIPEGFKL